MPPAGFSLGLLTFAHIKSKKKATSERYTIKTDHHYYKMI